MAAITLSPELLFGDFPEPVFLLRDGIVRYHNAAAARLLPGLQCGSAPPEEAALLNGQQGPAILLTRVAGADWRITVQSTPEGELFFFHGVSDGEAVCRTDSLAYHLRQQTAGLSAALQQMFRSQDLPREKYGRYLAEANQGLYRLIRLADHLEVLDRDRDYSPAPMDLAGLCQEVADGVEDVCRASGRHFSYDSALTGLLTVGDGMLLRRMLLALLGNAMKAAGAEGRFGLRLVKLGGRAVLTVWDDGPGLRENGLGILSAGVAGGGPSLDPMDGMGLGLPTVRRVAALHEGSVMIESRDGEGMRAIVSLPIRSPGSGMPLRSPRSTYGSGAFSAFSDLLVELSDVLPASLYAPEDTE